MIKFRFLFLGFVLGVFFIFSGWLSAALILTGFLVAEFSYTPIFDWGYDLGYRISRLFSKGPRL